MPAALAYTLAGVCFACTAAIGNYVSTRLPPAIDRAGMRLRGVATPLAAFFTLLGRWYAIVAIAALACGGAFALRRPIVPVLLLLGSQIVAQGMVSLVKAVVRRDRPERWLLRLEGDSSFPSGHATTSVVFFIGFIAIVTAWHLPSAAALVIDAMLAVTALGIAWSRLALEAHYATDVAGGLIFGTGWSLLTLTLFAKFIG